MKREQKTTAEVQTAIFEREHRKSTLTANVAFAVLKYAALTAAGVLLFHWGQGYALAERGYKAIGGEALLLGLPLFWYLTETTIRDTVRDFRKGGRRK